MEKKRSKIRLLRDKLEQEDAAKSELIQSLKDELESRDEELFKFKSMCRPDSANSVSLLGV